MTDREPTSQPERDRFDGIRGRIARKLAGFTSDFPADLDPCTMEGRRSDARAFPVPELALFALRNVMGWRWEGPGEKVRWSVYGRVDREPVGFELRKSGFTVLRAPGARTSHERIEGQLRGALKDVERILQPFADHQIGRGDVIIVNRWHEFEARYRFFRSLADKSYKAAARKPRPPRAADSMVQFANDMAANLNHGRKLTRQGFFHSTAMVDSYFSALEHRTVLLRAFCGRPLGEGGLLKILASKWDGKLAGVLDIAGDRRAEQALAQMRRIKERIRNPFAHGGSENERGSLFFHLPGVGNIPANFSRFGDSVRFSFVPIGADDHAETCSVFDQLDVLLSTGPMAGSHTLMKEGVDPSFDRATLEQYAAAVEGGDEAVEAFVERWGHEWERHANMDY